MTRWLLRGALVALVFLGAFALVSTVTFAEPPVRGERVAGEDGRDSQNQTPQSQSSGAGYTLLYSFSADPKDNKYVATFAPDVKQIYAWATIVEEGGAPQKQFTVDTQFVAPDGSPVQSEWYDKDTGTVTTYPSDAKSFGDVNVARRFINVAGTPNAQLTGQWTVNYTVGGKLIAAGNFTLAGATDIGQSDISGNAEQALKDAGYNVIEFKEAKGKSGNLFAYTIMLPASKDLYSSDTTQQIVDGLVALRQSFPNSATLYVFLRYSERYEVAYFADAPDVDAYIKSNDFAKFAPTITVDVWDNETGTYLGKSSKDFITKNFGAGTYQNPPNPPLKKNSSTTGSIRVTVSPSTLPADGASKAIVTVIVYDKRNQPAPNAEVSFETSGSGEGSIRPRVTSTDDNGQADAVFTAGKKNGAVTITAKSGGVTGSGVVTIGAGGSDPAADNVIGMLSAQGYKALKAGWIDAAKTTAGVVVDLGTSYNINDIAGPIIYGTTALRANYPEAKTLMVFIPYQENMLVFPAAASDYDNFVKAAAAAKSDEEKRTAVLDFLRVVFGKAVYVDRNGKPISTFKDFYNKNFTGG
ncbi:MAG: Ig-like domain-containing protein [Chloroflexi bacterium]|nr:Ig-like domain-containing protein [Chloroflexota bacterium]